jgi:choline dehydrogenase-like flavoprotein
VIAAIYRARVSGRVRARRDGTPSLRLWVPDAEARVVYRGLKTAADALLRVGARYVHTGIPGVPSELRSEADTRALLDHRLGARHLQMTLNHIFGSCPMGRDPATSSVDEHGKLRGVEGLYLADASLFPSPSAVNPQATIMALSDIISRRLAEA